MGWVCHSTLTAGGARQSAMFGQPHLWSRFTAINQDLKLECVNAIAVNVAHAADIGALVASVHELFQEDGGRHDPFMDTAWPTRDGDAYYASVVDDPDCLLLLARDGSTVVGHLVGKLHRADSIRLAPFAVLESMRVQPQYRGQGVGSLLVREFFAWARRHRAVQASVTAYAANHRAQSFYARHGFTAHSVTMRAPEP